MTRKPSDQAEFLSSARPSGILAATAILTALAVAAGSITSAQAAPFAYVTDLYSRSLSVIDTAKNKIVATILVGANSSGVAVSPDGKHAYATNWYDAEIGRSGSAVWVIATRNNKVSATIPLPNFANIGITVSPDNKHVYVTGTYGVIVIDAVTNQVAGRFGIGGGPDYKLAFTPNGKRMYVTAAFDSVIVVDTLTNQAVDAIRVGRAPQCVAIAPNGRYAYVIPTGLIFDSGGGFPNRRNSDSLPSTQRRRRWQSRLRARI